MIHADDPEVVEKARNIYAEGHCFRGMSLKEILKQAIEQEGGGCLPGSLDELPKYNSHKYRGDLKHCLICRGLIKGEHGNMRTHRKCRRERDLLRLARYYAKNKVFPHHHTIFSSYHVKDDFKGISLKIVKGLVIKKAEEMIEDEIEV